MWDFFSIFQSVYNNYKENEFGMEIVLFHEVIRKQSEAIVKTIVKGFKHANMNNNNWF